MSNEFFHYLSLITYYLLLITYYLEKVLSWMVILLFIIQLSVVTQLYQVRGI